MILRRRFFIFFLFHEHPHLYSFDDLKIIFALLYLPGITVIVSNTN